MGKVGIEDRLDKCKEKACYFSLRVGGLYDSRVGSSSDGASDESDTALMARFSAGYQFPIEGSMGLRVDYTGYADSHRDYDRYNIMEHTLALEPQYSKGQFVFGIPLSLGMVDEDSDLDSVRQSVTPTITWMIPGAPHALAVYGSLARLEDRDNDALDEDGTILGVGLSYLRVFNKKTRLRLSVDYASTEYDALVKSYSSGGNSAAKREDKILSAGIDVQYMINSWFGLFTGLTYIRSSSNVDSYDYNRNLVEAGIVIRN
ncbi:MAG: outer membrane beta-barrel protein [Pseudomonadota bacterium]